VTSSFSWDTGRHLLVVRSGRHKPDLGNDHGDATSRDPHYAFVMDDVAAAFLPMRRFASQAALLYEESCTMCRTDEIMLETSV